MSEIETKINKVCAFVFNFTSIDTQFIDVKSQTKFHYGYHQVPEPLEMYFLNITNSLEPHEADPKYNVLLHNTSYKLNFITAKIYCDKKYYGSLLIGPYLTEEPTCLVIEHVLFENKLSISLKHIIEQYYLSLPILSTYKTKLMAEFLAYSLSNLDSSYPSLMNIGNITHDFKTNLSHPPNTIAQNNELSAAAIEERYIKENKLMQAVEDGNSDDMDALFQTFFSSASKIPDRIPTSPLRSRKNLAFVLNTLLRKSAEKGGLHPIKVHSISEKFAIQIELSDSIQQLRKLEGSMHSTYCNAVRKYSLKDYSYQTRKIIDYIRIHLDKDLSLEVISNALGISSYELSRQFKKETGQAITEYINTQRVNESIYFLGNHKISITEIAHMMGFNDANYFTKVFKKIKGVTPSQYRKNKT